MKDLINVAELIDLRNFSDVNLKLYKPSRVVSLPRKEEVEFSFDGEYATVKIENFKIEL